MTDHVCAYNEATFDSKCYKGAGLTHSLLECVAKCGPSASPPCPTSEDENAFVVSIAKFEGFETSIHGSAGT